MFQFPGFASYTYGFSARYRLNGGFPHSDIAGSKLVCQLPHAFRRLLRPSSPPAAKAFTMCAYSLDHITQVTIDFGALLETHVLRPNVKPQHGIPKRLIHLISDQTSGYKTQSPTSVASSNATRLYFSSVFTSSDNSFRNHRRQLPQSITEFCFECICNNNAGQVYLRYIYHCHLHKGQKPSHKQHSLLNYNFTFHLVKELWRKNQKTATSTLASQRGKFLTFHRL